MKNFREIGVFKKPWKNRVKIALVYPNTYKVGMSSLGFQTIYRLLNEKSFITCERVFLPDKRRSLPKSVESQRLLAEFDFVLFSASYSTDFLHILEILQDSSIILSRARRSKVKSPILGAGGTGIYLNPESLAPVLDFFFLGEGESFVESFSTLLDEQPAAVKHRNEFLESIRHTEGIYIPEDLDVEYKEDGSIKEFHLKYSDIKIRRAYAPDLNSFGTYSALFSNKAEFGSIFMEEISRGCARGCRFCAIGFIGRPFRTRKPENLRFWDLNPGFKIGIVGAAISDHPKIKDIARAVLNVDEKLSFSSFRIDKVDHDILDILRKSKIKTFTVAPEAGSERLREIINKDLRKNEIIEASGNLEESGISNLKLYFMIGLPFENEEDIKSILSLLNDISQKFKRGKIQVSINPFVPKPFTPFQWVKMAHRSYLKNTLTYLKNSISSQSFKLTPASLGECIIDAIFSKGDRRLGEKILSLYENGEDARSWLLKLGKEKDCFIYKERDTNELLPWDFIDQRVDKSFLISEFEKAKTLALKMT